MSNNNPLKKAWRNESQPEESPSDESPSEIKWGIEVTELPNISIIERYKKAEGHTNIIGNPDYEDSSDPKKI